VNDQPESAREKTLRSGAGFGFIPPCKNRRTGRCLTHCHLAGAVITKPLHAMNRQRMHLFYTGHVQGVGFRFTVKQVAAGFEVTGTVRNLPDGRVELTAEGTRTELEAFRDAIREAGLAACIRHEDVHWSEAESDFRGFEIVR
jgi:acylphosphatase